MAVDISEYFTFHVANKLFFANKLFLFFDCHCFFGYHNIYDRVGFS